MSGSVDSSRRLDFCQAMTEFKLMFPDMDEVVIEAVLRANRGGVDATIDQLLTMNIDSDQQAVATSDGPRPQSSAKVNRILELIHRDRLVTSGTSESSYGTDSASNLSRSIFDRLFGSKSSARSSVDSRKGSLVSEQAESYGLLSSLSTDMSEDFFISETTTDESQVFSSSAGVSDGVVGCFGATPSNGSLDDCGFLPSTPPPPKPPRPSRVEAPLPPNLSKMLSAAAGSGRGTDGNPMSCDLRKKSWHPPLLGDLPEDFLRLDIGPPPTQKSFKTSSAPTYQSSLKSHSMQDNRMQSGDHCQETLPLPSARIQPLQPSSEAGRGSGGDSAGNII